MKIVTSILILFVLVNLTFSRLCSAEELINNKCDTLYAGYTYWWQSGGPFIGLCGEKYSLVFTGTITKLYNPLKTNDYSWADTSTFQKGTIKIHDIKIKKNPYGIGKVCKNARGYNGESYFSSDCFFDSGLKEGDKVIAFIYSYEGMYSIPSNSILKVKSFDDPIISSIEKYIKNNQDPLVIKGDTTIWSKYGLDDALKRIIDCRLFNKEHFNLE